MNATVFVSAGTPADDEQKEFRDRVLRAVEIAGLKSRLMSDRDWDYKHPLRGLRRAMKNCSGAIVIAYARYEFPKGIEKRIGQSKSLENVTFPTAWNQIEAAMAYEKELPLLIIAQNGLKQDAMFENTGDIRPYWTCLDPSVCNSEGFIGYLQSWKEDVIATSERLRKQDETHHQKITIRALFASLQWNDAIAVISIIITLITATLTIGYRLGSREWPF